MKRDIRVIIEQHTNEGVMHSITHTYVRSIFAILVAVVVCTLLPFTAGYAQSKKEIFEKGKELKGISFEEVWKTVREEGIEWAGDKLYISRISSGTFRGFDRHNGLSPVWEIQMVRCDEAVERRENGKTTLFCRGKLRVLRMVESSITGFEPGLDIKKETNYRGPAVQFEKIRITAQNAELEANQFMRYRSSMYDNYTYDLKTDHFSDRPIWTIKKACGLRGVYEGRCRPKDHWIVKIDGESGNVLN